MTTSQSPNHNQRRANLGRTMAFSLVAMVLGYLVAANLDWFSRDASGVRHEFEVMNTYARITIPKGEGDETPIELAHRAEAVIREVNDLMSPAGETSDVRRLNSLPAGTWLEVQPPTWAVVMEALRWHRLSDGAFDPTIGPIKRLFTFQREELAEWPDQDDLKAAGRKVGAAKIRFNREGMALSFAEDGMVLDLGAIAKGFAADRAAEVLIAHGVRNALVDIGGELRVLGSRPGLPPSPWRAAIKNPRGDGFAEELPLTNAAVATSGDYERYFIHDGTRYEHIIDPRTGLPVANGVASVTVIHPSSCLAADALATTLCVLGREDGEAFLRREALGLFSKGVRVIMLEVDDADGLRRTVLTVDDRGEVLVESELVE